MKFVKLFLLVLILQISVQKSLAEDGKVWLIRCARNSDDSQELLPILRSKGVNALNSLDKADSLVSPSCANGEKIQAFLFWEAEANQALEVIPSLKSAPAGFTPKLPKRSH